MEGAVARSYKVGSIIYFEGDKGDEIYIVQKGMVRLFGSSFTDEKAEAIENVKEGEFFGVKSTLGNFPREETARCLIESSVLVLSVKAFETLCMKNVNLMLRMLKAFSSQLRKVHKHVSTKLGELSSMETSAELLRVGEYYYKKDKHGMASYIVKKYIDQYPNSTLSERANMLYGHLKRHEPYPSELEDIEKFVQKSGFLSVYESQSTESTTPQNSKSSLSSNYSNLPKEDDLKKNISEGEMDKSASKFYYDGLNEFSNQNYDKAIENFRKVINMKSFSDSYEASFIEKSHFELASSYFKKENLDESFESIKFFVKKYPNSDKMKKALFLLANIFEKKKQIPKALGFYQKIAEMPPKDKDSSIAKKKIKELQS